MWEWGHQLNRIISVSCQIGKTGCVTSVRTVLWPVGMRSGYRVSLEGSNITGADRQQCHAECVLLSLETRSPVAFILASSRYSCRTGVEATLEVFLLATVSVWCVCYVVCVWRGVYMLCCMCCVCGVYVCCVSVYVCVCAHGYGGQRTTLHVILQTLYHVRHFCFLRHDLLLVWSSPSRQGWQAREPQGSPCPCLPRAGITRLCHLT